MVKKVARLFILKYLNFERFILFIKKEGFLIIDVVYI